MTRLLFLLITLLANVLVLVKFRALVEARSRLGGLRLEALRIERFHEQARLKQVARSQEAARRMAEATGEIQRLGLAIEEYRSRTAAIDASIAALSGQIDESSSRDRSINAYLMEHGKACAVLLRGLNAKQMVAVPRDNTGIEAFRELLRAKNLERKFEALNDMASMLGGLSLHEKSAVRLSHFYNGWLTEALGDEFPKDDRVRLALERRFAESIQIGVGLILKPAGQGGDDALRKAVFDEIDGSVLDILAEGRPGYHERIQPKVMSIACNDPMIANVYQPLYRVFARE